MNFSLLFLLFLQCIGVFSAEFHDAEMQGEWSLQVKCYTDVNLKNRIENRDVEVMLNFQGSNFLFPNILPKIVQKIICPLTCP